MNYELFFLCYGNLLRVKILFLGIEYYTILFGLKYLFFNQRETCTKPINTGTSTSGPMTAANAAPELIPKTAIATAIASSKLLLAAVNDSVAVFA